MILKTRVRAMTVLAVFAVALSWAVPWMAAGGSRSHGIDNVFDKHGVSTGDRDQIGNAIQAAQRAGADEREVTDLVVTCLGGEFTVPQIMRVISLASQLALEDLPLEAFASKVGEGIAKRADPGKVLQVAERRALMMNKAKVILNGILLEGHPIHNREELIPDVAGALESGSSPEMIRQALTSSFQAGDGIGTIRRKLFP